MLLLCFKIITLQPKSIHIVSINDSKSYPHAFKLKKQIISNDKKSVGLKS